VVRDADKSVAMANAALGIEPSLRGAGVRESDYPSLQQRRTP
jgi:hypothetical protein